MTRWLILGVNPGLRGLFFRSFSYAHLCSMLSAGRIDPSPESFFKAFEVSPVVHKAQIRALNQLVTAKQLQL